MIKVIRNAISKDLCAVQAWNMDLLNAAMGYPGDPTMDNAFGYYAPVFLEGMLLHMKDIVEREVQKPLHPTYSYGRIYYAESELTMHTDRPSSEWAVTCCLDKDTDWQIHFETGFGGLEHVELDVGDICIYKGVEYPHWRDVYTGKRHVQAMFMYVEQDGVYNRYALDGRERLCQSEPLHKRLTDHLDC